MLLVGLVGDFAGLALHLGKERFLFVDVFMCHRFFSLKVEQISVRRGARPSNGLYAVA